MEFPVSDCANGSTLEVEKSQEVEKTPEVEKNGVALTPVPLKSIGEGLPYAPVDFPDPGDVWTWKVGSRVNPSGYHTDRYLFVPKRLQKTKKIWLGSKTAVTQFIRSEFPDVDIDMFFSTFTWEIPAEIRSTRKDKKRRSRPATPLKKAAESGSRTSQKTSLKGVDYGSQTAQKTPLKEVEPESQNPRKTRSSAKKSKQFTGEGPSADNANEFDKLGKSSDAAGSVKATDNPVMHQGSSSLADYLAEMTQEDFEFYLNSLDNVLYEPVPRALNPGPARPQENDLANARVELSSLLSTGITSLVNSDKLSKIMNLSSMLQFDPYLSPQEVSTLDLIKEIPSAQGDYLEARRITSEAAKFFSVLKEKKAIIEERKKEFIQSKGTIAFLQGEEGSASSTIRELDEQLALLKSRRAVLAKVVETNQKRIAELRSKQKEGFDSVPKIMNEVQMGKSEKPLWELRQKEAAKKEEEILTKFAPLEGFSFLR